MAFTQKEWIRRHRTALVLVLDGVALAAFFHWIPAMGRPFDVLALTLFGLGVATVVGVRHGLVRNIALTVAMLGGAVFGLEMAEKKWGLFDRIRRTGAPSDPASPATVGDGTRPVRRYGWNAHSTAQYLAARDAALSDGMDPGALAEHFAGDVFAGKKPGWSRRIRSGGKLVSWEGDRQEFLHGAPLGWELAPVNRVRYSCRDEASGRMVVDSLFTVNASGFRETPGGDGKDQAGQAGTALFLGCSVTFGFGLSDDETLPFRFAEASGFRASAVNLGVSGYGPHQSLRDMELDRHPGRAGMASGPVLGVVYSLIDDHPRRAANPGQPGEPRYRLEGGKLVFAGTNPEGYLLSRLATLLDRGRIYPRVRSLFHAAGGGSAGDASGWDLTHAILEQLDALCRGRYGVGLTVVYWNDDRRVPERLARAGIRCIGVNEAFGPAWRREYIKYAIYDGHPSAYANRLLGRHLWLVAGEGKDEGRREGDSFRTGRERLP